MVRAVSIFYDWPTTAILIVSLVFKVSHDDRNLCSFLPGCSRVYIYTCMLSEHLSQELKGPKPVWFDNLYWYHITSVGLTLCSCRRCIPNGCFRIYTCTPPYPYPPVCQRLFCVSDVSTIYNLFVLDVYILSYCHRQYQINIPETH